MKGEAEVRWRDRIPTRFDLGDRPAGGGGDRRGDLTGRSDSACAGSEAESALRLLPADIDPAVTGVEMRAATEGARAVEARETADPKGLKHCILLVVDLKLLKEWVKSLFEVAKMEGSMFSESNPSKLCG